MFVIRERCKVSPRMKFEHLEPHRIYFRDMNECLVWLRNVARSRNGLVFVRVASRAVKGHRELPED